MPKGAHLALIAVMAIRGLCAFAWAYMGIAWAGPAVIAPVAWNLAPGILALWRPAWAIWVILVIDGLSVAIGLLALEEVGRLHGGEIVSYAAIPSFLEMLIASWALRQTWLKSG